jgi:threonine-phosphate decarboxylase
VETVKEAKEPWTVNTLAQIAGTVALDDIAYKRETFEVIEKEKERLAGGFARLGISYLPSAANYFLLRITRAQEIAAHLRTRGILVRDCSNFAGLDSTYLRVAVKSQADNMRLLEEIASCGA